MVRYRYGHDTKRQRNYAFSSGLYLLFEVFIIVDIGDDQVQVIFDVETFFDAAHRWR